MSWSPLVDASPMDNPLSDVDQEYNILKDQRCTDLDFKWFGEKQVSLRRLHKWMKVRMICSEHVIKVLYPHMQTKR